MGKLDFTPSNENPFGVALLAGRVVGTIQGSTGHITVRATCKAKVGGSWKTVPFEKATHVFFDVPGVEGDWADKIGTLYPAHSDQKWAGHYFEDRAQTDSKRLAAARYLMGAITGENNATHVQKSERCARCSRELTHPDSIFAQFGPECIKHVAPWMPNRSGSGDHEVKTTDTTPNVEPIMCDICGKELRGGPLDHLTDEDRENCARIREEEGWIPQLGGGWTRSDSPSADPRAAQEAFEATRALPPTETVNIGGERGENITRPIADFVPPKPDFGRAGTASDDPKPRATEKQIIAVLRRGDDPKEVLASLDA